MGSALAEADLTTTVLQFSLDLDGQSSPILNLTLHL